MHHREQALKGNLREIVEHHVFFECSWAYKLTLINRLQQNTVKNTDALVFYNVTKKTSIWHLQMLSLIITLIPHFFKMQVLK